jgi:hypothetical protein
MQQVGGCLAYRGRDAITLGEAAPVAGLPVALVLVRQWEGMRSKQPPRGESPRFNQLTAQLTERTNSRRLNAFEGGPHVVIEVVDLIQQLLKSGEKAKTTEARRLHLE